MAGTMQKWKVECEDGFAVISSKEHELVQHVQQHVKDFHQKVVSREDVMKMAKKTS
jgi:predicted small metal-binding protein